MPQMPSGQALMQGAQVPQMPPQQMMPQPKKPGFNDPGGWGEKLQMIGAQLRDDPGLYSQLLAQKQQAHHAQQQAEAAQQQAAAQDAQWYQHEDYKRTNPDPATPSPEQRLVEWANGLQGPEREKALQTLDQFRPKMVGDPLSGYQFAPRPMGQVGQPSGQGMLQVSDAAGYEAVPAGQQYMDPQGHIRTKGGPASQSPGGFPR